MFPENEEFRQAMMSQIYAQFASNPYIELEALTRKSLYTFFRSETESLMKKPDESGQGMGGGMETPTQTVFGQQAQNKATDSALPGVGRV
jgi:hypothetical protein